MAFIDIKLCGRRVAQSLLQYCGFFYFARTRPSVFAYSSMHVLFQPEQLQEMLHLAIINDRSSFVRLFLQYVKLKEFVTFERLTDLYNDVSRKKYWRGSFCMLFLTEYSCG